MSARTRTHAAAILALALAVSCTQAAPTATTAPRQTTPAPEKLTFVHTDALDSLDSQVTNRITTKDPAPFLLERLARMRFMPPKETAANDDSFVSRHPVGTGPYKLAEWTTGVRVVLERNDDYWGPRPAYRTLVFRQIAEQ